MNIKTTISIIAIVMSSMSMAEAGQNRHDQKQDRHADRSHNPVSQERHYRTEEHRKDWRHANNHGHDKFRGERHHRKHAYYKRHNKHFNRSHVRHAHWILESKRGYNKGRHYRDNDYNNRSSRTIVVSGDPLLPVIAGGIVAAKIAKNIIRHDPILRTIIRHDPIARALLGR
jgi:hypothetical protein